MRYLVRQHDKSKRFPTDVASQYGSEKWLDWQVGTLWPMLRTPFLGLTRVPENERNYEVIKKGYQDTNALLDLLDGVLANQAYCSGKQFHIGDIALALCASRWMLLHKTFPEQTGPRADLKNIDAWIKRLEQETRFNDIAEKELNIVK
jgi:glutathione S-transferase